VLVARLEHGGDVELNEGFPAQLGSVHHVARGRLSSLGTATCFLQFADGVAATIVYNGRAYFDTAELFWWIGEGGQPRAPDTNFKARLNLKNLAGTDRDAEIEEMKEREMRYGARGLAEVLSHHGWEAPRTAHGEVHQPFFGFTLVSCERGDIRQSPDGLIVLTARSFTTAVGARRRSKFASELSTQRATAKSERYRIKSLCATVQLRRPDRILYNGSESRK